MNRVENVHCDLCNRGVTVAIELLVPGAFGPVSAVACSDCLAQALTLTLTGEWWPAEPKGQGAPGVSGELNPRPMGAIEKFELKMDQEIGAELEKSASRVKITQRGIRVLDGERAVEVERAEEMVARHYPVDPRSQKQKRRDLKTGDETEHVDYRPCTKCGKKDESLSCWDDEAWCSLCVFADFCDTRLRRRDRALADDADLRRVGDFYYRYPKLTLD